VIREGGAPMKIRLSNEPSYTVPFDLLGLGEVYEADGDWTQFGPLLLVTVAGERHLISLSNGNYMSMAPHNYTTHMYRHLDCELVIS